MDMESHACVYLGAHGLVAEASEINAKSADGKPPGKRGKLIVTDGVNKCTALLSSQNCALLTEGQLHKGAIIQLDEAVSKSSGLGGVNKP
jgi:hypothetical protein